MSLYSAKRLPVHGGVAAWSAILPNQDPAVLLEQSVTADVAIIGAGFAGLAAARRVLQLVPDAKVVVLEAGRIAEGASGRNSGFMIDLPHELGGHGYDGDGLAKNKAGIAMNRQGIGFAKQAVEDYGIDRAFFDPVGKVNGAASARTDKLNHSYAEHLAELGEASEYLDAKSMTELTGSRHYVSGLYTPGTVMIQPAGFVRGLARGLRRQGVQIFENAPVLSFESKGKSWALKCPAHQVIADKVILANNGHLESFGFAKQRLMHIFLYASMTVDLGPDAPRKIGGQPRWGVTPSHSMGTTVRRIDSALGGNRIVTRNCFSFLPDMVPSEAALKRAAQAHRKKFAALFPAIAETPMEYTWAGHLCLTRNGVAVTRELDYGLFSACVQNGLGTVRGTLTGMAAAELACGKTTDLTRHFTAEPNPTKLLPPPISTLGANAYLRWQEWAAGAE